MSCSVSCETDVLGLSIITSCPTRSASDIEANTAAAVRGPGGGVDVVCGGAGLCVADDVTEVPDDLDVVVLGWPEVVDAVQPQSPAATTVEMIRIERTCTSCRNYSV